MISPSSGLIFFTFDKAQITFDINQPLGIYTHCGISHTFKMGYPSGVKF
jgi:hypothetical protein